MLISITFATREVSHLALCGTGEIVRRAEPSTPDQRMIAGCYLDVTESTDLGDVKEVSAVSRLAFRLAHAHRRRAKG